MRRDHVFRFCAFIAASRLESERGSHLYPEIDAAEQLVLHRFLDVFPPASVKSPCPRTYARLSMPPDRGRLTRFIEWLREESQNGAGIHQHPQGALWAYGRLWRILRETEKPLVHESKPAVVPHVEVSPAVARHALEELLDGAWAFRRPTLRKRVESVLVSWEREVQHCTEDSTCIDCQEEWVYELFPADHLVVCEHHPALERLEIARRTAQAMGRPLAPVKVAMAAVTPPERTVVRSYDARRELEDLAAGKTVAAPNLCAVVAEWEHYKDRSTDPCPWCGAVLALEKMLPHLRSCERHPAHAAAVQAEAGLDRSLLELVGEHHRMRRGLELLLRATERFTSEMGWDGEHAYSKSYSERPWLAALAASVVALGKEPQRSVRSPPAGESPPRAALNRLLADPGWSAEDASTLRQAAAELHAWTKQHGYTLECPACRRPGLPWGQLVEHLERCPVHPAVARLRAAHVELGLASAAAIDRFAPRSWKDESPEYHHQRQLEAIERLIELEPSELSKEQRASVEGFVAEWEEMQRSTCGSCDWCEAPADVAHLLRCEAHPANVARQSLPETRDGVRARLRMEADRYAIALAYLAAACGSFWSGMSDGERGKSLSNPRIEKILDRAVVAAKAVLGRPDSRATK